MFRGIKGTQDVLDLRFYNIVIHRIEKQLQRYNFLEIQTPILEPVALFERGLGYGTEVVSKQMFVIDSKSSKEMMCLRPESTAGTMRAYLEKAGTLPQPWKVYSVGPMFRYERPQKGRYRQFHQCNIEMIGQEAGVQDTLFIAMLYDLFTQVFSVPQFWLEINFIGQPEDRKAYETQLLAFAKTFVHDLCDLCKNRMDGNVLRMLDCKNQTCQDVYADAPKITDCLSEQSAKKWQVLQEQLHELGVSFTHNPKLVRGLDYYTDVVFEFVSSKLGSQSAFAGGGRYDGLAQQLGSKKEVPSIGAAIGLERLYLLLEEQAEQLSQPAKPLHVVITQSQEQAMLGAHIVQYLTYHDRVAQLLGDDASFKSKMRKADKLGAKYVLIIGEQEQADNKVTVKNMQSGEQLIVTQDELLTVVAPAMTSTL